MLCAFHILFILYFTYFVILADGSYYYLDTMEQIHGDTFYYTDSDFTQINGFPISNTAIVIVVNE